MTQDNHFTNNDFSDAREAFLSSLSPFDRYERLVTDYIIELFECDNGDAQGIAEVNEDTITRCFADRTTSPSRCAQIIFDYRFATYGNKL